MKWIRYSKYTGEDLGIDGEDLLKALSDFLLESGFNTQYMPFTEMNQRTLEDLKKALQQALEDGKLFDDDSLKEMMERLQNLSPEQMDKLLENLVQKMVDEGQITIQDPSDQQASAPGIGNGKDSKIKFEVTDKSSTFSASRRSRTCSGRSANRASGGTIRATWLRESRPPARPRCTNSATC